MANLISDKPITSETADVLGLTSFADALAKSLAEMAPDDGLVISVQGEWSSGKTSALVGSAAINHSRACKGAVDHDS